MSKHIRFISAGAGSGKTYRITEELQAMLADGSVSPSGVIATTFTRLAATELRERVRQKLIEDGNAAQAAQMGQALIGTVNGVCGELDGEMDTEDMSQREAAKMARSQLAKEYFGDNVDEFKKIAGGMLKAGYIQGLTKDNKEKLLNRLESYYDQKIKPKM